MLSSCQGQREAQRYADGPVPVVLPGQPSIATKGSGPPSATQTAGFTPPKQLPLLKPEQTGIEHFAYFIRLGGNLRQLKSLQQFASLTKDEYIDSLEDIIRSVDLD